MTGRDGEVAVNGVYAILLVRAKAETARKNLSTGALSASSAIPEERLQAIFDESARSITLRELVALSHALDVPVTELLSPPG